MIIEIFAGIMILILLVVSTVFFVDLLKKQKSTIPINCPIVENYNTSLTNGYFYLIEAECKEISNNRYRCKLVPFGRWYDYITSKFTEELNVYDIIIEKNYRVEAVKGIPHKSRSSVIYLPKEIHNIPEVIKDTPLSKLAFDAVKIVEMKNMFVNYLEVVKNQVGEILLLTPKLPEKVILARVNDLVNEIKDNLAKKQDVNLQQRPYL